jgi:uncharacterized protein YciW
MSDTMDRLAGLAPTDPVYQARRARPQFVAGAEACRISVLAPRADMGLQVDLRQAIAHRIALRNADVALMSEHATALSALQPGAEILALAHGEDCTDPRLTTIARHVDLVSVTPREATRADITRLAEAGLDNPQIVALSELIAFVNFQLRVAAGLRLLRFA